MKLRIMKRGLAVLVAVMLCAGIFPFSAFAEDAEAELPSEAPAPVAAVEAPAAPAPVETIAPPAPIEAPAAVPEVKEEPVTAAPIIETPAVETPAAELQAAPEAVEISAVPAASEVTDSAAEPAVENAAEEQPDNAAAEETAAAAVITVENEKAEQPEDAAVTVEEEVSGFDNAPAEITEADAAENEAEAEEAEENTAENDKASAEEEAQGEEPAEEAEEEEVLMPAVSFSRYVNEMYVSIYAPEGAFPEGTEMRLTAVSTQGIIDMIENSLDETICEVNAVDISFWYGGIEIEPLAPIQVFMSSSKINGEAQVIHVDDNNNVDSVANADGGAALFMSDSFSIYAMIVVEASTPWEEENLTRASEISELDGQGFYISSTANNKDNINHSTYYFTDDIISWKDISGGVMKTAANDITTATVYYFRKAETGDDQFYIYYLDENSEEHFLTLTGGKNIGFTGADEATVFTVTKNGDGFSIGSGNLYFNLQGKDSGLGFQASSKDVIDLTIADENNPISADPYGLDGQSLGIIYTDKNYTNSATMSDSFTAEKTDLHENDADELIAESESAASLWTFESVGNGRYYIRSGNLYLQITSRGLVLTEDISGASEISVTPATADEAYEGRYRLTVSDPETGKTLAIRYNNGRFSVGSSVNSYNEWLYLASAEEHEVTEYEVGYRIEQARSVSGYILAGELPTVTESASEIIALENAENYTIQALSRNYYQTVKTAGTAVHFPYITYQFAGWKAENGSVLQSGSTVSLIDLDANGDGKVEFTAIWRYTYEEGTGYPTANFTIWRNISSADSSINGNMNLGEQKASYSPAIGSAIMYAYDCSGNEVWISPAQGGTGSANVGDYYLEHSQAAGGKYMLITYVDSSIADSDAKIRALASTGLFSADSNTGSVIWKLSYLPSDTAVLSSLASMVRSGATTLFDENNNTIDADELTTANFIVYWCQAKYQSGAQDGWNINAKLTRRPSAAAETEEPAAVTEEEPEAVIDEAVIDEEPEVTKNEESEAVIDEKPAPAKNEKPAPITVEEPATKNEEPKAVIVEEPAPANDEESEEIIDEEPAPANDEEPSAISDEVIEEEAPIMISEENDQSSETATPVSIVPIVNNVPVTYNAENTQPVINSIEETDAAGEAPAAVQTVAESKSNSVSYKPSSLSVEPVEYIEDEAAPLAAFEPQSGWALLNLILIMITSAMTVIKAYGLLKNKSDRHENRSGWIVIIPELAAAITFIVTENMSSKMVMTDKWTVLMAIYFAAAAIIAYAAGRKEKESEV